jgi:hypothetical protein
MDWNRTICYREEVRNSDGHIRRQTEFTELNAAGEIVSYDFALSWFNAAPRPGEVAWRPDRLSFRPDVQPLQIIVDRAAV